MVRCARSSTSLVWGIPVHPTHLLRAIKTHERILPALRALRGCHLFAPDPPTSRNFSCSFTVATPAAPFATASLEVAGLGVSVILDQSASLPFTSMGSPRYPPFDASGSSTPPAQIAISIDASTQPSASRRKGIGSLPAEILELIEAEMLLSAHEEDVPRSLVNALEKAGLHGEEEGGPPGCKRICLCGERYVETGDVLRCRERVLTEIRSDETRGYLLKHFGLTTDVISTPLKHSVVLLVLPHKVSTLPAQLLSLPSLPIHPPVPRQLLSDFPHEFSSVISGRLPRPQNPEHIFSALPSSAVPLVTPSDDFISHLHHGMFSRNHWRLRNQNFGMRASVIDPAYLLMTEEKLRRFRWCVEELVLWNAIRIAREELKYEELGSIEHFEMTPSAGRTGLSKELNVGGHWWGFGDYVGEDQLAHKGREKKPKVGANTEAEAVKRERKCWVVVLRPELWLLEELTYEP